jgi:hypothetical protein
MFRAKLSPYESLRICSRGACAQDADCLRAIFSLAPYSATLLEAHKYYNKLDLSPAYYAATILHP